eukprot:8993453-Karenia_brevis.AAC.1
MHKEVLSLDVSLNVINFNPAISVSETVERWLYGMLASDVVCTEGPTLNVISFNTAISACVKGGQWQRVAPVSDEMHKE